MTTNTDYTAFETWGQLIDHISAGYALYYHAPMDYRPAQVSVVVRKDGQLRVSPIYADADPFTADAGHLGRFRKMAGHVVAAPIVVAKPKRVTVKLVCQECGRKWRVSPNANDPQCPKCGGVDYEVAE